MTDSKESRLVASDKGHSESSLYKGQNNCMFIILGGSTVTYKNWLCTVQSIISYRNSL